MRYKVNIYKPFEQEFDTNGINITTVKPLTTENTITGRNSKGIRIGSEYFFQTLNTVIQGLVTPSVSRIRVVSLDPTQNRDPAAIRLFIESADDKIFHVNIAASGDKPLVVYNNARNNNATVDVGRLGAVVINTTTWQASAGPVILSNEKIGEFAPGLTTFGDKHIASATTNNGQGVKLFVFDSSLHKLGEVLVANSTAMKRLTAVAAKGLESVAVTWKEAVNTTHEVVKARVFTAAEIPPITPQPTPPPTTTTTTTLNGQIEQTSTTSSSSMVGNTPTPSNNPGSNPVISTTAAQTTKPPISMTNTQMSPIAEENDSTVIIVVASVVGVACLAFSALAVCFGLKRSKQEEIKQEGTVMTGGDIYAPVDIHNSPNYGQAPAEKSNYDKAPGAPAYLPNYAGFPQDNKPDGEVDYEQLPPNKINYGELPADSK